MCSQINEDKTAGVVVVRIRAIKNKKKKVSFFISLFTKNKVLASWFSHCGQWGRNRQCGRTNNKKWVLGDIVSETGNNFENLLWKKCHLTHKAKEAEAKNIRKGGCRKRKRRWFKTPVLEGQGWWRARVTRAWNYGGSLTGSHRPFSSLPASSLEGNWRMENLQKERGQPWHQKYLILSAAAVILYSFQIWVILPTGSLIWKGLRNPWEIFKKGYYNTLLWAHHQGTHHHWRGWAALWMSVMPLLHSPVPMWWTHDKSSYDGWRSGLRLALIIMRVSCQSPTRLNNCKFLVFQQQWPTQAWDVRQHFKRPSPCGRSNTEQCFRRGEENCWMDSKAPASETHPHNHSVIFPQAALGQWLSMVGTF